MPTDHSSEPTTDQPTGSSSTSARAASMVTDTGWWLAKTCSQPGMNDVSTKADDAKTSGAISGNMAAWAVSALGTLRPTRATIHDRAKANSSTSAMAATYLGM